MGNWFKEENNGVLIVLSVSDRKVWVSVGYGLEGKLPDSKTGRLLDEYAVPSYKDNQFEKVPWSFIMHC